jgi:hypothetical protein
MFRRSLLTFALVALGATTLPAQEFLWAGLARSVAIGRTADTFDDGYLFDVGIAWRIGNREDLNLQTGLLYGGNKLSGAGGTVDVMGFTVGLGYSPIQSAFLQPYVLAGVGYIRQTNFGASSGEPAYFAGGGMHGKLGDVAGWWLEARYLGAGTSGDRLELLPVTLGLTFPLKRR